MASLDEAGVRTMPSAIEAEQCVLGALLMHNDGLRRVADILTPEHFYEPVHRTIFDVAVKLIDQGKPANPITMRGFLGDVDLGGVTAGQYLARLAAEAVPVKEVRQYAALVADAADRRRLISIMQTARDEAFDPPPDLSAAKLIDSLQEELEAMRPAAARADGFVSLGEAVQRAIKSAERAYQRDGGIAGLSTGYTSLDDGIGGLEASDLIVIAGRPGAGKTALATNIAFNVANHLYERRQAGEKGVVGFFSMEMSADQLGARILAEQVNVSAWRVRRGRLHADEMERYVLAPKDINRVLASNTLVIDDHPARTIAQVFRRAREWNKKFGLSLVVVDYLQLMSGGDKGDRRPNRQENRTQEVSAITAGLKALAKELSVPVIALSQLSRQVESRDNKRPLMSDLRESGSIEQDADVVAFVYREEYYVRQNSPKEGTEDYLEWERKLRACQGVAEIIIAKQRHGPACTVHMGFNSEITRFTNSPPQPPEPEPESAPRERKKKHSLPKEATTAWGLLKSLSITAAVENKGDMAKVPRGVRPVPYLMWRDKCAEALLDPSFEEKDAVALMKSKIVPALMEAGLIDRGGSRETPYVWLTEKGQ